MSKNDIKENVIDKIRTESNPGDNTKERVANAMDVIVDAIPDVVSEEGNNLNKAISQKIWTDANRTFIKNGNNIGSVHIVGDSSSSLSLGADEAILKGYAQTTIQGEEVYLKAGSHTTLSVNPYMDKVYLNDKELATTDLSSSTQAGLMSIDHYKSLEDMITNFENLVSEVKRIADAQGTDLYDGKYPSIFIFECERTEQDYDTSKFLEASTNAGNGHCLIVTDNYSKTEAISDGGRTGIDLVIARDKEVVRLYSAEIGKLRIKKSVKNMTMESPYLREIDMELVPYSAPHIDFSKMPDLRRINFNVLPSVTTVDISKNPKLTFLSMYLTGLTRIDLSKNPLLTDVSIGDNSALRNVITGGVVNFKTLSLHHTLVSKENIVMIGQNWTSRVGSSAGSLYLSESIFNDMTAEEKAIFTNKNISLVIR